MLEDLDTRLEELSVLTLARHGRLLEKDRVRRRAFGLLGRLLGLGLGLGLGVGVGVRLTVGVRVEVGVRVRF